MSVSNIILASLVLIFVVITIVLWRLLINMEKIDDDDEQAAWCNNWNKTHKRKDEQ